MKRQFVTVDVFTDRKFGGNPLAVFPDAQGLSTAEMQAIRDAARRLGTRDLSRCELYGTSRACTMCEAAAYWAGIARMIHGEGLVDAGAPRLR